MHRRTLLKHGLVGITGIGTGYALVEHSTGNTHASLSMGELSISNASKTTNDGKIDGVEVDVGGDWSYKLPAGKSPHRWQVTLLATNGEEEAKIGSTNGNAKYLNNNGSYQISGGLTDTGLYSKSDFAAPEGKVKTVTIGFILLFEVVNESGKVLARATLDDTANVAVTNEAYKPDEHGSASGDGGLTILTD